MVKDGIDVTEIERECGAWAGLVVIIDLFSAVMLVTHRRAAYCQSTGVSVWAPCVKTADLSCLLLLGHNRVKGNLRLTAAFQIKVQLFLFHVSVD